MREFGVESVTVNAQPTILETEEGRIEAIRLFPAGNDAPQEGQGAGQEEGQARHQEGPQGQGQAQDQGEGEDETPKA